MPWDETLYAGSAAYYVRGRMPYQPALAEALRGHLGLDGTGRLLDVGCGPGSFTLAVADRFAEVVGIEPDGGMLGQAVEQAERAGIGNVRWVRGTAEGLPAGLADFDVISFAQSFHWLDRERVAAAAYRMLTPGGVVVHVQANNHEGVAGDDLLPHPRPPHERMSALVAQYLGPVRRAGRSSLPTRTPADEDAVLRAAGFEGPDRVVAGGGEVIDRSEDQVVAALFSLSSSTPALFGERLGDFESDLRGLLREVAPDGVFAERRRESALDFWWPGAARRR